MCREVSKRLDGLDFEGKRATFGARVQATREDMSMTVVVDPKVTTTARTSASSSNSVYSFVVVDLKEVVHYAGGQKVIEFVPC